jgi:hypothetical protein
MTAFVIRYFTERIFSANVYALLIKYPECSVVLVRASNCELGVGCDIPTCQDNNTRCPSSYAGYVLALALYLIRSSLF